MLRETFTALVVAGLLFTQSNTVYASDNLQTLLMRGQQAPGLESGVTFNSFTIGSFNAQNDSFTFRSTLVGPDVDLPRASSVWTKTSEGLSLIARLGDAAPGGPDGSVFVRRLGLIPGTSGKFGALIARASETHAGNASGLGIWKQNDVGELELVALAGQTAPGANDNERLLRSGSVAANGLGQVAVAFQIVDITTHRRVGDGLFRYDDDGGLKLVARAGNSAPGIPVGLEFRNLSDPFDKVSLSDTGRLTFVSQFTGFNGTHANPQAIVSQQQGSDLLELIALSGNPAPGTEPDVLYDQFRFIGPAGPTLSDTGQLAFRAGLAGSDVDLTNNVAIWSARNGASPELLVRKGDQPPDYDTDNRFSWFDSVTINDHGQTVFRAGIFNTAKKTNETSLWKGDSKDDLQLIARSGDIAPGTDPDITFRAFFAYNTNFDGQAVVYGFLEGPDIDEENDRGIWAEDSLGNLNLIARMGDTLNVSDDPLTPDFRTVRFFGIGGINDQGQVLFNASFADGTSGVFLSNVVAVPEPTTAASLLLLSVILFAKRWEYKLIGTS